MKNKKAVSVFLIGLSLIVVVILGVIAGKLLASHKNQLSKIQDESTQAPAQTNTRNQITYNGKEYTYDTNLTNILFLGVDKKKEVEIQDTPGLAGQADCIMILSLDNEANTARVLQVSRDSMTEVDIYDVSGNYYTSVEAQIATQYAYGNGEKSSCWAMERTVGELLHDLPIDAYLSLNMESISSLNDAVGGVTITIPQDYTEIDPSFTEGAVVTLSGEQAEKYVRYRNIDEKGSNNERMKRQVQYTTALVSALKGATEEEESYYERFSSYLRPYMVTDMEVRQIDSLANYEFLPEETQYVPGEIVPGAENEEFHVDDEALLNILVEMFYKPKE